MNDGVDRMNKLIEDNIIPLDKDRIKFINIDPLHEGYRFCEPNAKNDKDAFGEDSSAVWLNTLWEDYLEEEYVEKEYKTAADLTWEKEWKTDNKTMNTFNAFNDLHKQSCFHPKIYGHLRTTGVIDSVIRMFAREKKYPDPPF